jgi:hypothetical protein
MTTSLRPSLTYVPDTTPPPSGPCPTALRHALAEAARRVLAVRPCPVDADFAGRLAALAKAPEAAS